MYKSYTQTIHKNIIYLLTTFNYAFRTLYYKAHHSQLNVL